MRAKGARGAKGAKGAKGVKRVQASLMDQCVSLRNKAHAKDQNRVDRKRAESAKGAKGAKCAKMLSVPKCYRC